MVDHNGSVPGAHKVFNSRVVVTVVLAVLVGLVFFGTVNPMVANRYERIIPGNMLPVPPEIPVTLPPSPPPTAEPTPSVLQTPPTIEPTLTPGEPVAVEDVSSCKGAKIPAGYEITEGIPHAIHTPYSPNTLANPISIVNFTQTVSNDTTTTDSQRKCLIDFGVNSLLKTATRSTWVTPDTQHRKVLWFHYGFEFSPNPSVSTLEPGWISGLAQGGALSLMVALNIKTGDPKYLEIGQEIFNSYLVPIEYGGFVNRDNGFLWFEEYPSQPPTVVNNGHFDAAMALKYWAKQTGSSEAEILFNEAVQDTLKMLPLAEVPYPGGMMSSYDLIRGYPAAPLRLVGEGSPTVALNGTPVSIPVVKTSSSSPNVMKNSDFSNGLSKWRVFGPTSDVKVVNGAISIVSRGGNNKSTGALNEVPAGTFNKGEKLSVRWKSKLVVAPGEKGFDGKVVVQENCPGNDLKELYYNTKVRSPEWVEMSGEFEAPSRNCKIRVQLMTNERKASSTTVWFDDVTLQRSDDTGATPFVPEYNMFVWETPVNTLTVSGKGSYRVQAYEDGRWWEAGKVEASKNGADVNIPERFTGRNVNYKYHEGHVHQLRTFGYLSNNPKFLEFADRWAIMSPTTPK